MNILLAGNHREFLYYQARQLIPVEWVDGTSIHNLIGHHFDDYKIVGTFWERHDAHELVIQAKTRLKNPR